MDTARLLPALAALLLLLAPACVTVEDEPEGIPLAAISDHRPSWNEIPDDGVLRDLPTPEVELARDAQRHETAGRWSDARVLWGELESRGETDEEALLAQVRTLHAQGFDRQASDLVEMELARRPDDFDLLMTVGWARLASGDVAQALEAFEACVALEPKARAARHAVLAALLVRGDVARIVEELSTLSVAQVPGHLLVHLGRAALMAGENDLAAQCFSLWLAEHPGDQDVWVDMARAQILLGDHATATSSLASARRIDPTHPRLALLSGHVAYLAGDQGQALRMYALAAEQGVDPLGLLMRFWRPSGVEERPVTGPRATPLPKSNGTRRVAANPRRRGE